ncbi:MAG: HAMP domain-containing protein [Alphaproteobacteria bacterium]|nr:HAMP domain-containing protein [Alphaproteobacteria bacterium]
MKLTDTIAGRTVLVLVLGLGSILFLAQYLYQVASERELLASNANRVAERLLVLAETITAVKPETRDTTAHSLSGGPLELHWSEEPLSTAGGRLDSAARTLRTYLLERAPALSSRGLIFGTSSASPATDGDQDHTTVISLGLEDGSWLNVTLARVQSTRVSSPSFLVSLLVGALGVVVVAVLLSIWLTRPLNLLAKEARTLFVSGDDGRPVAETGTREVRTVAAAINEMHRRIDRLISDRTQMLAAISHDLRTPLTRLRLRATAIDDETLKKSVDHDLDEMEQMIDAALGFLKEGTDCEPVEPVDIAAILQTIADDAQDAGHAVDVELPRSVVVKGRHLALKRALTNLVNNAVRHGGAATITVRRDKREAVIIITDPGPGIPPDKLETVFEPFRRLDDARNLEKGGYGLGLTVARSVARSHGGDVILANRPEGGLAATFRLPV